MKNPMERWPRSPGLWGRPAPATPLPAEAMARYPASPKLWERELEAHEAGLRERAAAGDAGAAASLAKLPAMVIEALGTTQAAGNSNAVIDWVAARFPAAG